MVVSTKKKPVARWILLAAVFFRLYYAFEKGNFQKYTWGLIDFFKYFLNLTDKSCDTFLGCFKPETWSGIVWEPFCCLQPVCLSARQLCSSKTIFVCFSIVSKSFVLPVIIINMFSNKVICTNLPKNAAKSVNLWFADYWLHFQLPT